MSADNGLRTAQAVRKRLLIALLLLSLPGLPIALLGAALYTESGLRLLAAQLPRLERFGIAIEGVSGTLAGPLRVERFELDHPRVHVLVRGIVIEPELRGLLIQTIRTRSVRARDALVELRAAEQPPSERPPRFLPRFLRIDARGVDLRRLRYVHLNGAAIEAAQARGRVTIVSDRLRIREFDVAAEQFDARGHLALMASRPLGLKGAAAGRLRLLRKEFTLFAALDGSLDRLQIAGEMQQPSRVRAAGLLTRPEGRWRLAGKIESPALGLDAFVERPPFSLRNVALDVSATAQGVHASGAVSIPEFSERAVQIDARGRFAARVLHLDAAKLALDATAARVAASGSIAFDGGTPTVDIAARWQDLQWPLEGAALATSAGGAGTLRGPMPYDFSVAGEVARAGAHAWRATGAVRGLLSQEQLTIAAYELKTLGGTLQGAGALQFAQPRAWTLSANASGVNPAALHPGFPGRVSFTAHAEGSRLDKRTRFKLRVAELAGTLRGERVRGAGHIERDRQTWIARGVEAQFGKARLKLDAALGESLNARWTLHAPALASLLPGAAGAVDFSGSVRGARKAPHIVAAFRGEGLRYQTWAADRLQLDADVDVSDAAASRFTLEAQRVGRAEPLIGTLHVEGSGLLREHRIVLDAVGVAPSAREPPPRAMLQAAGRYQDERWTGTIASLRLARGAGAERTLDIVEPARAAVSREAALLENVCLAISAGRICAQGEWRRGGAWEAVLSGYEIPLAFVLPPAGEEAAYAGRIEGRIRANGAPGRPWRGDAGMRIIDAAIIYRPPGAAPQALNLGTGGLAATADAERIDFSFGVQAFTDTFLYANAQLRRDGRNDLMRLPLTGDLRARAADANILPLVFPEIDHAAGLLTAEASLAGSLAAPEINGRIELANGEFDSYRVNLALRDLSLTALLHDNALDFKGAGRAGEGRAAVDGRFAWRQGETLGELRLHGENLLVADLPEYRVVASPDLRFRIAGGRMDVAGDVKIPSALLQPNELTGAVRASDDTRYVGEHPAERAGRYTVHSEVRIAMGEDVRVDAFGLQGRITGGVGTTIHTGETPLGRGELGVEQGRYEAYGQQLEISRGRLLFDVSPLDDPGLDIEARRKVDATTVGLNVRGTLQAPRLTFFSDPSMPQTQIVSYLLTGKSVDSIQSRDAAAVRSVQDTLALQGGGLLASQIGRRVGLDEVGVESSIDRAGEASSQLVVGKFLSPRLFISYGVSLTESINTLKLRYTISDRWILRTEAGERQSADVEFTVER